MVIVKRLLRIIDDISDRSGSIISVLWYFMLIPLILEVILRYGFNRPTIWAHEIAAMVFGAYFMLGAAYCLRHKGHIAVDVLYLRLSERKRAIIDIVTFIFFLAICVTLIWHGGIIARDSWQTLEHSNSTFAPPLYYMKTAVPLGTLMLLVQGLAKLIRDFVIAITGKELEY